MLEFIKGEIIELTPASVILETEKLGYILFISLQTYSSLIKEKNCKLYVYEHIKENVRQLFGFANKQERQLFLHLISVSSVGVNTARMILSSLSIHELEGIITSGNSFALKAIKGIGNKTAERIIIDLKDKVKINNIPIKNKNFQSTFLSKTVKEAICALVMLGFNQSSSQKMVCQIIEHNPNLEIEQIIKQALKMM